VLDVRLDEVAVASAILRIDEFVSLFARENRCLIAVAAAVVNMHIGEASMDEAKQREESYWDYYYYFDKEMVTVVELDGYSVMGMDTIVVDSPWWNSDAETGVLTDVAVCEMGRAKGQ
jgi:hypothetical protein